jgi:hypothetical protein
MFIYWNLVIGMYAGPSYINISDSESEEETYLRGKKDRML